MKNKFKIITLRNLAFITMVILTGACKKNSLASIAPARQSSLKNTTSALLSSPTNTITASNDLTFQG